MFMAKNTKEEEELVQQDQKTFIIADLKTENNESVRSGDGANATLDLAALFFSIVQ